MGRRWVLSVAALALSSIAFADEITLKSGGKIVGRVVADKENRLVVEVNGGTLTISKSEIVEWKAGRTAFDDFDDLLKKIQAGGAKDFFDLGVWAREKGLTAKAREMFRRAIEKDGDFEPARRALGFIRYKDQWLTPDELNLALGFVKIDGRWMLKGFAESKELDALERRIRKIESAIERISESPPRPAPVFVEPRYPIIGIQPAPGCEPARFFPYYGPTTVININVKSSIFEVTP